MGTDDVISVHTCLLHHERVLPSFWGCVWHVPARMGTPLPPIDLHFFASCSARSIASWI
jgi:hypothetical protein